MSLLPAGHLDRRIILQRPNSTRGPSGATVPGWQTVATVWSEVRPASAREFIAGAQEVGEQRTVFRIRHRTDIDIRWRIDYGGQTYRIVGVAEIGRKEGLELQAVASPVNVGS